MILKLLLNQTMKEQMKKFKIKNKRFYNNINQMKQTLQNNIYKIKISYKKMSYHNNYKIRNQNKYLINRQRIIKLEVSIQQIIHMTNNRKLNAFKIMAIFNQFNHYNEIIFY